MTVHRDCSKDVSASSITCTGYVHPRVAVHGLSHVKYHATQRYIVAAIDMEFTT